MEMWRPRLRCTLQHSSHTSTPLLMEAQPGSGRGASQPQPDSGGLLSTFWAHTLLRTTHVLSRGPLKELGPGVPTDY